VQIYIDLIWPIAVTNLVTICHFWLIQRSIVVDGDWQRSEYAIDGDLRQTTVKKAPQEFIASKKKQVKWNLLSITPDNLFAMLHIILKMPDEVEDNLAMSDDASGLLLSRFRLSPACD